MLDIDEQKEEIEQIFVNRVYNDLKELPLSWNFEMLKSLNLKNIEFLNF
jgi:hypothetical protein